MAVNRKALDSKIVLYSVVIVGAITAGLAVIPIILIQGIVLGVSTVWEVVSEVIE